MEQSNGYFRQGSTGRWRSMRDGDFQEEDVWDVIKAGEEGSSCSTISSSKFGNSNKSRPQLPTASRLIRRTSMPNSGHEVKLVQQQSAPVNIPDWSKIYGKKNSKKKNAYDDDDDDDGDGRDSDDYDDEREDDDYDDDDEFGRKVPPHELIARRLARSQISSFSVCEGIGRTLKGRDLSKVRNAVLTKTGFLE